MKAKMSVLSRVLLGIAAVLLVVSVFQPIWQIQLDAPQYPEGLVLKIFADKLGGDVEIVNGLNHYIGMKTLHAEDFIEFTILKYIIYAYALLIFVTMFVSNRKFLYVTFSLFLTFGIVAMADFWRWEYNYGHDLNPNAAIIVPGMAYQPPLIGFKQLLNFGAYSIPDIGGWLFVSSGLLLLAAVVKEVLYVRSFKKQKHAGKHSHHKKHAVVATGVMLGAILFSSCSKGGPEAIKLNADNCDFCKMSISDERFACELVTTKGRAYKFDDMACLIHYKKENKEKTDGATCYADDFLAPHALKEVKLLGFIKGEAIESPMGGGIAAFSNTDSLKVYANKFSADITSWSALCQ